MSSGMVAQEGGFEQVLRVPVTVDSTLVGYSVVLEKATTEGVG